jgi:UPF0716 protein FxsA
MKFFFLFLILFTVLPALEIYFLIKIGGLIGAPATLGCVLLTGIAGAALARSQGFRVIGDIQRAFARGVPPARELFHGALVLVGGVVLLTPGFITDLMGLLLLIPPIRALILKWLMVYVRRKYEPSTIQVKYTPL